MSFPNIEAIITQSLDAVRPPERLNVAEAAEKYRKLNNRGAYVGPWRHSTTPYLVEPMEELTSPDFLGEIFVGSAQSGKTDGLFLNFLAHTVKCDPMDMMLVEASQSRANDFSKRRVSRMHRDSPEIGKMLMPGPQYDGIHDKRYMSGVMLRLSWPSITELSGRPIPRMFLTDYDRMPLDVDGEGAPYDLARARTTTFGRNGMTAAESSPSYPVIDPNWVAKTPHEAPPCEGVLALYNRGDRRRWYWACVMCGAAFEPSFRLLTWKSNQDLMKAAESVRLPCPHCGASYRHEKAKLPGKYEMNLNGFWMKDGQSWDARREQIVGEGVHADIASFWLKGVASAFKDWRTIIHNWLTAEQEYLSTGSEAALQTTVNTDQCEPYTPKSHMSDRAPEKLMERAFNFGHKVVPMQVTYLVAAVDVQKNRFVVQVTGVSPGGDYWIVDRFDIRYSERQDPKKEGQFFWVSPFTYREDWRLLVDQVIQRGYPLGDGSGRHMAIKAVICDSGGMDQGTANAYEFYRWLKSGPSQEDPEFEKWEKAWTPGMHARFQLFKGESKFMTPRTKLTYPDSGRQSKFADARGDIPVLRCNVTTLKNQLDGMLDRTVVKTGLVNFAEWLPITFYKELCVEVKSPKGIWENPRNFRNESWDLLVMTIALNIERRHVGLEHINWDHPPPWAAHWDENPLVYVPEETPSPFAAERKSGYSLAELGRMLG